MKWLVSDNGDDVCGEGVYRVCRNTSDSIGVISRFDIDFNCFRSTSDCMNLL